ncbi:MAG: DUF1684 domain-containing protein [Anaerolineales bacterium]|nr:DUF1684 domain-containing protein [Anaerolineales bacterium]
MIQSSTTYHETMQNWHDEREAALKAPGGWLTLAGLFWLEEGNNSFGSDPGNDIVFPTGKAPGFMGSFLLKNGRISVELLPQANVTSNGRSVTHLELKHEAEEGGPTILEHGLLTWYIIKRGDLFAIRLKDLQSSYLAQFNGIGTYPWNPAWRVEATFVPYDPPKTVNVPTMLGTFTPTHVPGALVFNMGGQEHRLDVHHSLDHPSIVYADATTAKETYGGGRFLLIDQINPNGTTIVDFNKSINPPCAFSPFATCPLPTPENRLPIPIHAGELAYHYSLS